LTGRAPKAVERTRFERYLRLLVEWNRTHRLTAIRSAEGIVADLFVGSLLYLSCLPPGPIKVADLGTGPGIPGVPLRIVRDDIALTLVESKRKRVSFLAALKRELELSDLSILEGRAEELVKTRSDLAGTFDVVVSAGGRRLNFADCDDLLAARGPVFGRRPPDGAGKSDPSGIRRQSKAFDKLGLKRTFSAVAKALLNCAC
jgi:16S rRNA (guanine(527)-N(7))-methyltransferase RsmG